MADQVVRNQGIKVSIPRECHLWNNQGLTADELRAALVFVKLYEDDSHLIRNLLRCRKCGHLFFHEFYELVDWTEGNDAQYSSWIPVDDVESADRLNALSPFALLRYTSLRVDYPSNAQKPTRPYWNTTQSEK